MNRAPANKENVIPIPARYPCQKDIGVRSGKRKAETNLGVSEIPARSASSACVHSYIAQRKPTVQTQWMKDNAALKRQNHGTKLVADSTAQQPTALQTGVL